MVVKYSSQAKIEWIYPVGTMAVRAIASLPKGGYLIAGNSASVPGGVAWGSWDGVFIKLNDSGRIEYAGNIGSNDLDDINAIVVHDDGFTLLGAYAGANGDFSGLAYQGNAGQDDFAFRYDAAGRLIRRTVWGGSSTEQIAGAAGTADGGIIVAGSTGSSDGDFESAGIHETNGQDAYLLKLSAAGEVEWVRCFGGTGTDSGVDVLALDADEYLLAAEFYPSTEGEYRDRNKGYRDIAFLKVNGEGVLIWDSLIGGTGHDFPLRMRRDVDGDVLALVTADGTGDFADVFYESQYNSTTGIIKVSADDGEVLYKTRYRVSGYNNNLTDFDVINDGGILAVGRGTENIDLFKGINHGGNDGVIVKYDGIPKSASKTMLAALIASAELITPDASKPALSAALATALSKAQSAVSNPYASQNAINGVAEQLRDAMDNFNSASEVSFDGLTANGTSDVSNTTELTLSFGADPGSLRASDISVTGATDWDIAGSGLTRTVSVSGLTVNNNANLTVNILRSPEGSFIIPTSKTVQAKRSPEIEWRTLSDANGKPAEKDTTVLKLEFDNRPVDLNINNITVEGATKRDITYVATDAFLTITDITVSDGGTVGVTLEDTTRYHFVPSTKTVTISKALIPPAPDTRAPVLGAGNAKRSGSYTATVNFASDEAGTARYLVTDRGAAAPDAQTIIGQGSYFGAVAAGPSARPILVSPGAKDVYIIVTDASGNVSEPLKITVIAYGAAPDKDALEDGDYSVGVDLFSTGRTDKSMADNAIGHAAVLTVSGGAYYLTFDIHSLKVGALDGYLSRLNYYDPATYDSGGNPDGATKAAIVLSYQTKADGSYITDAYNDANNPYPKRVQFPLVNRAGYDGDFVPLQLFVPIMEEVMPGSGTQNVLLRIDWNSLRIDSALAAKISEAAAIPQGDKGAAAHAALKSAIAAARSVLDKPGATQAEVDAALAALNAAIATFTGSAGVSDDGGQKSPAPDVVITDLSTAKISAPDKVWTGRRIISGFDLTLNGTRLAAGVDYDIAGTGVNRNIGIGTVRISGKGSYSSSATVTFKILPKSVKVKSAKAGKRVLTIKWGKAPSAEKITKYEVRWKVKNAKSWSKARAVAASKASFVAKKLKKGRVYQVQVRAYKKVAGVKYYGAWSNIKKSKKIK
jgi:YD repeat-containing protein